MQTIEDKHARVLLDYALELKAGEKFSIRGNIATLPLIRAVHRYAIQLGALPQVRLTDDIIDENILKYGSDEQVQYIPATDYTFVKDVDVTLTLFGGNNTRSLSRIEPEKMKRHAQGRREYLKILYDRIAKEEVRWCGTQYPTDSDAQEAGMSLPDYQKFVYEACLLYADDPAQEWRNVSRQQERLCTILNTKKRIRIVAKDTDLSMSVEGRKWINCDGKMNFPDGEVFSGPVEDSVEGHVRFSFPAIYMNREVEDIRLTFEKGKIISASAAKGEDFLNQILDTDPGARYMGEIAVGTNYNIKDFTKNILFDEKIGGTVHMAMGRSIPECLGKNESAIHWDMLCDMKDGGEIYADDALIYRKGAFVI